MPKKPTPETKTFARIDHRGVWNFLDRPGLLDKGDAGNAAILILKMPVGGFETPTGVTVAWRSPDGSDESPEVEVAVQNYVQSHTHAQRAAAQSPALKLTR